MGCGCGGGRRTNTATAHQDSRGPWALVYPDGTVHDQPFRHQWQASAASARTGGMIRPWSEVQQGRVQQ